MHPAKLIQTGRNSNSLNFIYGDDFKFHLKNTEKGNTINKRILLCDWEGNITWTRDNEFNYTHDQILEKNKIKKQDKVIQKWFNI